MELEHQIKNYTPGWDYYCATVNYDDSVYPWQYHGMEYADILCLRRLVANEDGAYWVSVERKANIVACVMNGIKNSGYSFDKWIAVCCAPYGFDRYYCRGIDQSVIDAVDYYFQNKDTIYADWIYDGWHGDGHGNTIYDYYGG